MLNIKTNIQVLKENIKKAEIAYPITFYICLLIAIFWFTNPFHIKFGISVEENKRLFWLCPNLFLISFLLEKCNIKKYLKIIVIAIYLPSVYYYGIVKGSYYEILLGYFVLLAIYIYIHTRKREKKEVYLFSMFFAYLASILYAFLAFVLYAILYASVDFLFHRFFSIPDNLFFNYFPSLIFLFSHWVFLGKMEEIERIEDFAVEKNFSVSRKIVNYLLQPFAICYGLLLYLYFAVILFQKTLFQDSVSHLIIWYLLFIFVLQFYHFYSGKKKSKFLICLLPFSLLSIYAVYLRVSEYGITQGRYWLIILCAFEFVSLLYFLCSPKINTSRFALFFAVLFGITSYFPYNSQQISRDSQIRRFKKIYMKEKKTQEDRVELKRIAEYLSETGGEEFLKDYDVESEIKEDIMNRNNINYSYYLEDYANDSLSLELSLEKSKILLLYSITEDNFEDKKTKYKESYEIQYHLHDEKIMILEKGEIIITANLKELKELLLHQNQKNPIVWKIQNGEREVVILPLRVWYEYDDISELSYLSSFLAYFVIR